MLSGTLRSRSREGTLSAGAESDGRSSGREGVKMQMEAAAAVVTEEVGRSHHDGDALQFVAGQTKGGGKSKGLELPWTTVFFVLLAFRILSAAINIIHDCDETFNYWEPLHFLLHGYGFQTWEYSSEFSLRSYLYLLLHAVLAAPCKLMFGEGRGKLLSFYCVRASLAAISAAADATLISAVRSSLSSWADEIASRASSYALVLLCFTSGSFLASTTFLPSTFSMYGTALASALLLLNHPALSVATAAFCVLIGWPFAVLAAAPMVLLSLLGFRCFWRVFCAGVAATVLTVIPSIIADRIFYGRWTCSILNLVVYNVAGGGDSALYGVEGPFFYLRNGFNNFNLVLPLALVLPLLLAARIVFLRRIPSGLGQLVAALLPIFVWLGFMSLQPHKEERFLYVIYPHISIAAAISLALMEEMLSSMSSKKGNAKRRKTFFLTSAWQVARFVPFSIMAATVVISCLRTAAVLSFYAAPMHIYSYLPQGDAAPSGSAESPTTVCLGSEWHRFPSSFFLPSANHRAAFLDDGFQGLLPMPFDSSLGGTASAPKHFNNQNKMSPSQFLNDEGKCDFLVELILKREGNEYYRPRGDNATIWKEIKEIPFLDSEKSPGLFRAFYIPFVSNKRITFGSYRLLQNKHRV